jgi:hypothetical protein
MEVATMMENLELNEESQDGELEQKEDETVSYGEFHTHDLDEFHNIWDNYDCFSVVCLDDGTLKLVIDNGLNWLHVYVEEGKDDAHIKKNGMTYSYIDFDNERRVVADHGRIRYGCVMLPLLSDKSAASADRIYTVIRSDWRMWDGEGFDYINL